MGRFWGPRPAPGPWGPFSESQCFQGVLSLDRHLGPLGEPLRAIFGLQTHHVLAHFGSHSGTPFGQGPSRIKWDFGPFGLQNDPKRGPKMGPKMGPNMASGGHFGVQTHHVLAHFGSHSGTPFGQGPSRIKWDFGPFGLQNDPKRGPKYDPKWDPRSAPGGAKRGPKSTLFGSILGRLILRDILKQAKRVIFGGAQNGPQGSFWTPFGIWPFRHTFK